MDGPKVLSPKTDPLVERLTMDDIQCPKSNYIKLTVWVDNRVEAFMFDVTFEK